jgi:hypothetical protein
MLNQRNKYVIKDKLPENGGTIGTNVFCVFKGYSPDETGLRNYQKDFLKWANQLKSKDILSIYYEKYYGHNYAALNTFKRLSGGKEKEHTPITMLEDSYWSKCNNGALTHCEPEGIYDSYGYDFVSQYPSIMADDNFMFPKSEGYETTLSKLPISKKLKVGCYRVAIQSSDKRFCKIFSFSKNNIHKLQFRICPQT